MVSGVTRIRQALSLEVASYDGVTNVRTARDEYALNELRRVVIVGAGGSTSGRVSPLTLNPADAWDRQYLGVAIELDRALTERSRGLTLQSDGSTADVQARLLDVLSSWSELVPLGDTAVGEAIIAAELATAARLDTAGLHEMLLWRADGASWGIIAFELGLTSVPALPGVDETAIPATPTTSLNAVTPGATTPSAGVSGPRFTVPGAGPVKPTPTTPTTTEPAPVVVDPLGGVVSGLGNVLGGLLGG